MMQKYFKPKSLTWWASVTPLLVGIVLALSEAFPSLAGVAAVLNAMTGGIPAAALINAGLVGIGLRGAMDK
jgi:hypothetical protein